MGDTSSPLYPSQNDDLVIQTSDRMPFGIHSLLLRLSSSVMNDMLAFGSEVEIEIRMGSLARGFEGSLRVCQLTDHITEQFPSRRTRPYFKISSRSSSRQNSYHIHGPYLLNTSSGRCCQVRRERCHRVIECSAHGTRDGKCVDVPGPPLGLHQSQAVGS